MKKHILVLGAAVLALGFSVSMASAATLPCPGNVVYQHPVKAKQIKSSLTSIFVSCNNPGGNVPNDMTVTGTPTCSPAETVHERDGNPTLGWKWGVKGTGSAEFKAGKNKVVATLPLVNPAGAVDLYITIKMSDVLDENGPADGTSGKVSSLARATLIDRGANVLMTVIDFPTGFAIPATKGKVNKKTSATVILNNLNQPALPECTNIELLEVLVLDPVGAQFATLGTYLP